MPIAEIAPNRVPEIGRLYIAFPNAFYLAKFLNFDTMQVQVNIGFDQLVQIAKRLPATQWQELKQAVDSEKAADKENSDLEAFLLTAPTFTKKQLDEIAKTRKAINQWRTK